MEKKSSVKMLGAFLLVAMLTLALNVQLVRAPVVILTMDNLPENEGWMIGNWEGASWVSNGILTIESPDFFEYIAPADWISTVSNERGWIIETKMKIDPSTVNIEPENRGSVQIWIHDSTYLTIVGFDTDKIYIAYPDRFEYSMDTTDNFHVYKIVGKGDSFRVFVDGNLALDYHPWSDGSSWVLAFGDGLGGYDSYSKSYWDYFLFDTTTVVATIDIEPATLNVKSKAKWITAYIELPAPYSPTDIDVSTVKLNGIIQAELHPIQIGDYDGDGILDLMVKFNRANVMPLLHVGMNTLTVTGEVNGIAFEGSDTIIVKQS